MRTALIAFLRDEVAIADDLSKLDPQPGDGRVASMSWRENGPQSQPAEEGNSPPLLEADNGHTGYKHELRIARPRHHVKPRRCLAAVDNNKKRRRSGVDTGDKS